MKIKTKFDTTLLCKNMRYLIECSGKSSAAVERETGTAGNYFYRILDGQTIAPHIGILQNFANVFGVSIDSLLTADISSLNNEDVYVISFLEKLVRDTMNGKIEWFVGKLNTEKATSNTFGNATYKEEESFECGLNEQNKLAITNIATKEMDTIRRHKEVSIKTPESEKVICSTAYIGETPRTNEMIERLFATAKKSSCKIALPRDIVLAINDFMKG